MCVCVCLKAKDIMKKKKKIKKSFELAAKAISAGRRRLGATKREKEEKTPPYFQILLYSSKYIYLTMGF